MKYKKILAKSLKNHIAIEEFISTESFDKKELFGESLKEEIPPKIIIKNKSGKPSDFLIGGTALLIISEKAKIFLEENIEFSSLEFIPVQLENYNKNHDLWMLHILERLACFDWEKSDYTIFDEVGPNGNKVIRRINKMVLKDDIINQKEIFYVEESLGFIFVSEKLEKLILQSDLIGYRFI